MRARNNAGDSDDDTNWWGFERRVLVHRIHDRGAGAPDAVTGATAAAASGTTGELTVGWTAPANNGGAAVHYYTVRHKVSTAGDDTYVEQIVSASEDSDVTITGLTSSTEYTVQVRAHNVNGSSAWTSATGTPG